MKLDPFHLPDGYRLGNPQTVDPEITDPDAIALWNTVMRAVKDANGATVLRAADTVGQSVARKIECFLLDEAHIAAKFGGTRPKAKQLYHSAGFSKSKWNRIVSGELCDITRGNLFAIAVALRLSAVQTEELLFSAGFVLNYELDLDVAMLYFINRKVYDMATIYRVLGSFCDVTNGLDRFYFQPTTEKSMPIRKKKSEEPI